MTTAQPERFDAPNDNEPRSLDELVREFDASDGRLLMTYARYVEGPTEARYRDINRARDVLYEDFEEIIENLQGDEGAILDEDQRTATYQIVSTLIVDASDKHDEFLAEYLDERALDPKKLKDMHDELVGYFEAEGEHLFDSDDDDGRKAFTRSAVGHLGDVLDSDDNVIGRLADDKIESPGHKMKAIAKRVAAEAARVAVASAVTLAIVYTFKKR